MQGKILLSQQKEISTNRAFKESGAKGSFTRWYSRYLEVEIIYEVPYTGTFDEEKVNKALDLRFVFGPKKIPFAVSAKVEKNLSHKHTFTYKLTKIIKQ